MQKLITELDEVLGKLETIKSQARDVCDLGTLQGVSDWLSLMSHINFVENQVYELIGKVIETQRDIKVREQDRCMKCED